MQEKDEKRWRVSAVKLLKTSLIIIAGFVFLKFAAFMHEWFPRSVDYGTRDVLTIGASKLILHGIYTANVDFHHEFHVYVG
jgi:hypothetical protein